MSHPRTVLFLLPFGLEWGVGHLVRQSALAKAARNRGCQTILWSDGDLTALPPALQNEVAAAFTRVIRHQSVKLPSVAEQKVIFDQLGESLAAVIMDDFRPLAPAREAFEHLCGVIAGRAPIVVVDGVETLATEFAAAQKILNLELAVDLSRPQYAGNEKKILCGSEYALVRESFFHPEKLSVEIPAKSFLIMMGGTDPMNVSTAILDQAVGCGYTPVLLARKNSPHAAVYTEALKAHPGALWLEGLTAGEMNTLLRAVSFSVMGPSAAGVREHFAANRCPVIAVQTNPSLRANTAALAAEGLPTIILDDKVAASRWGSVGTQVPFIAPNTLQSAIAQLEAQGIIANRLPNRAPFNSVDGRGAVRILEAIGL